MKIVELVKGHYVEIILALMGLMAFLKFVVKLTKTPKDDAVVEKADGYLTKIAKRLGVIKEVPLEKKDEGNSN